MRHDAQYSRATPGQQEMMAAHNPGEQDKAMLRNSIDPVGRISRRKPIRPSIAKLAVALAAAMPLAGCEREPPVAPRSTAGAIRVNVTTTGASIDLDPDGYTLAIDGGPSQSIATIGTVTIPDLPLGRHVVRLDGLQPNCSVGGENPRSVDLGSEGTADAPALVSFSVSCVANTGSIRVSAVTSGLSPDPDGYVVVVDNGVAPAPIAVNGSQVVTGARVGERTVRLTGLSRNCTMADPDTRKVNVTFGGTAEAAFAVQCAEAGALQVTAITTGGGAYPGAYRVGVGDKNLTVYLFLPSNGTAIVSGLAPGNYVVTPFDIPAHCDAPIPPSLVVSVGLGGPTPVALNFACPPPTQIALVQNFNGNSEISVVNSDGTGLLRLTNNTWADEDPVWSPDGTRIAYASNPGNFDIYVMTANGHNPVRLTSSNAADRAPTWSPDGARIAFVSERDGNAEIYVMNADGTNQERLTSNNVEDSGPTWSPDGGKIAFRSDRSGAAAIWVMNSDGSGGGQLTSNSLGDFEPAWSPDGSKIAFVGRVSGSNSNALFIINSDGTDRTRLRYLGLGGDPAWSPDGRKIAFVDTNACNDYGYYSYCYSNIEVIGFDGITYLRPLRNVNPRREESDPSWRPR